MTIGREPTRATNSDVRFQRRRVYGRHIELAQARDVLHDDPTFIAGAIRARRPRLARSTCR